MNVLTRYSWLNKSYNFSKLVLQETKYKKEESRDSSRLTSINPYLRVECKTPLDYPNNMYESVFENSWLV